MNVPTPPMISVCVCTYQRPQGLQRLLDSLRAISVPEGVALELLVVDNDGTASGRLAFEQGTAGWPWPARYVVSPRSGVGYARARCVEEARGEWVAYIDDDEWAEPQWLAELWRAASAFRADGVFGPVLASFEQAPPDSLVRSGVYARARRATGTALSWSQCASGNALFRRRLYFESGGFNPAFAQSGSEDVDFFWRCLERNARFVWCDEAVAHEAVPPVRTSMAYLRRRAYREGQNYVRLVAHRHGWLAYLVYALRGLFVVGVTLPLIWGGRLFGVIDMFRYERKLHGGLGKILAAWAPVSREYGAGSATPPVDSQG